MLLKGIVKDEQTLQPIRDVNIKVYGAAAGTSTDKNGTFSLQLKKIPVTLVVSCIGYENSYYDITNITSVPVEFLLTAKAYMLKQVDISSSKYSFLFNDRDYSVLDYEILGDNLLLLVFRYQLKRSELVLLDRSGDTLAVADVPEGPPASLYKDFLSNVHYFSKTGNAYQCFYNGNDRTLEFLYKTTVDTLLKHVKPFIFKIADRLYFQEKLFRGFGTGIGYYEKGKDKKYILKYLNRKKAIERRDDRTFYQSWNVLLSGNIAPSSLINNRADDPLSGTGDTEEDLSFNFAAGDSSGGIYDSKEKRATIMEYFNMIYPVIKTSENKLKFFNFYDDVIETLDADGNVKDTVHISFHRESASKPDSVHPPLVNNSGWRWGTIIQADACTGKVYTLFLKNGRVKICRVDLETGNLSGGTVIPFTFPEKIVIYRDEAYFLYRDIGEFEKWKLVKVAV